MIYESLPTLQSAYIVAAAFSGQWRLCAVAFVGLLFMMVFERFS